MAPTRWGIVGAGKVSHDFVSAIGLLPSQDHQIVAVAARNKNSAQEFGSKHEIAKCFGSYSELVKQADVEVVYVGIVNSEHKAVVIEALNAGKHVVCEKCLGVNHKEVQQMVSVAKAKGLFLMEAFWTKFFPVWNELNAAISSGEFGQLQYFSASFSHLADDMPVLDPKLGGGQITYVGCYLIMVATMLFKEYPSKINVAGFKSQTGADHTASIQLVYKNGAVAHLSYNGSIVTPRNATIIGTKGAAYLPDFFWCPDRYEKGGVLRKLNLPAGNSIQFHFPHSSGLAYEAEAVRQCLLKGLTECPEMALIESEIIARITDEVRRQLGVHFPQDS